MAAWSDDKVIGGRLWPNERPAKVELPGCWDLFTDEALIELLADASSELGRRGKDILVDSSKRVTA